MKKILGQFLGIIIAANFGILSAFFPIIYIPLQLLIGDESIAPNIITALICGIASFLTFYIYKRRLRLNQEEFPSFLNSALIGYLIGIFLMIIFIVLTSTNNEIPYM